MFRIHTPEQSGPVRVKICGLRTPESVTAAAEAGAGYIGFVFFEKSPRNVTIDLARELALEVPLGVAKVALTVNADDSFLGELCGQVPLDFLQLHGNESPERVVEIRERFGLPVMKAVGVATEADLGKIETYSAVADQILIDAKPAQGADLPGGNGISFDWKLIANRRWACPWMLAGGLTPKNVAQAIELTGAKQVDVSSGVEIAPGIKDESMIKDFINAAQKEHSHE